MKKLVITLLVAVFALTACDKPVTSGKIVEKYHKDATRSSMLFCAPKRGCFPMSHSAPERWVLVLESCQNPGKCRQGEMEVNREIYSGFEVGNQYHSAESPK